MPPVDELPIFGISQHLIERTDLRRVRGRIHLEFDSDLLQGRD